MTSYQDVYDVFLRHIDDVEILYPLEDETDEEHQERLSILCYEYLRGAISRFFYAETPLTRDDANNSFVNTLRDVEVEILGLYMLREYYRKKLNFLASLRHSFSDKDWKSHDKSNAMNQYRQMLKEAEKEIEELRTSNSMFDSNGNLTGWW